MEKKQSSIDWLMDEIQKQREDGNTDLRTTLFYCQQAKAMHKEEIIESYCQGCLDMTNDDTIFPRETTEQYYTKTFGDEKEVL